MKRWRGFVVDLLDAREAGKQDYLAGVLEHLLEPAVAEVGASPAAPPQNPEGPYYVPGAPAMDSPCSLSGVEQRRLCRRR